MGGENAPPARYEVKRSGRPSPNARFWSPTVATSIRNTDLEDPLAQLGIH